MGIKLLVNSQFISTNFAPCLFYKCMKNQEVVNGIDKRKQTLLSLTMLVIVLGIFYFVLSRRGFLIPLSDVPSFLCFTCQSEPSVGNLKEGENLLNYERSLKELLGSKVEKDNISLLVEKSKYRLTVFDSGKAIKSYPVVFGGNPKGDKLHEGDQKTPEGIFRVKDFYPHADWSKFIWLDYPTPTSWRKHFKAKLAGEIDFALPIGGEIGIHGVPSGGDVLIDGGSNWTLGCVSLKNRDVDEIYEFVKVGTVVEIVP